LALMKNIDLEIFAKKATSPALSKKYGLNMTAT